LQLCCKSLSFLPFLFPRYIVTGILSEMDDRVAIPVTLPQPNPTISYWQDPPDAEIADYLSAESTPETADTVIIGSGITGTSIAHGILNGKTTAGKIVMLEARQACSGATGRNGAFFLQDKPLQPFGTAKLTSPQAVIPKQPPTAPFSITSPRAVSPKQ
jgi:hypothetical protein